METLAPLELLNPETQTLIMCHISGITTLHSLILASPRFYQVFRSRRDYHLTQLATQHSLSPANGWDAIRASKLPKPPSCDDIGKFLRTFLDDHGFKAPIISPELSIPMIKLRTCVDWFVKDFACDSLCNLTRLGELLDLKHDGDAVQRKLSAIESQRIARAFCRFETFTYLFRPQQYSGSNKYRVPQQAYEFLNMYEPDEMEEIACVRDYIIRRLWRIFDRMEDDFVAGEPLELLQKAAQASDDENWFGESRKEDHMYYMENLMSCGLPFLRELLTADRARSAELVICNSLPLSGYLTDAFVKVVDHGLLEQPERLNRGDYLREYKTLFWEDIAECSIGWHWSQSWLSYEPGYPRLKGCRDWGYIFWERSRMKATGVLNKS